MSIVDQIVGAESGGNPYASNPRSSAVGLGQFISSTWLDTLRRHRPYLLAGRSPQELLALRTDPNLSKEMTAALASDNANILRSSGIEPTPGSVYLAHFAGPKAAVNVLKAGDATPAGDILGPAAVKANPFLSKMTVGDLRAWAGRKMGGSVPQAAPQAGIQPPVAAQPAPSTPAPSAIPSGPSTADLMALQAIPAMAQQQQMQMPAPPPLEINYPVPPGLIRARLLAQAMANQPISQG